MAARADEYKLEKEDLDMGLIERHGGDMLWEQLDFIQWLMGSQGRFLCRHNMNRSLLLHSANTD